MECLVYDKIFNASFHYLTDKCFYLETIDLCQRIVVTIKISFFQAQEIMRSDDNNFQYYANLVVASCFLFLLLSVKNV